MKLTEEQAKSLFDLIHIKLHQEQASNLAESLVRDVMFKVYKKIRTKLESFPRKGFGVQLSPIEAKAFYIYFEQIYIEERYVYERNILAVKMAEIDKLYA